MSDVTKMTDRELAEFISGIIAWPDMYPTSEDRREFMRRRDEASLRLREYAAKLAEVERERDGLRSALVGLLDGCACDCESHVSEADYDAGKRCWYCIANAALNPHPKVEVAKGDWRHAGCVYAEQRDALSTKLAEVERERDAAARELASLPITIRVAGHGPVMARVTTFDNARMLFAGLQATSENGGNFGWVIEDTRPPIIPAIAPQPAEKEESR